MLIAIVIAAAVAVQAGSDDPRRAYVSCLKDAVASAKGANVAADGFNDYAHTTCATIEGSFRSKLVQFNVTNGMSKKSAAEDAQIQLDDYLYTAAEKYRYSVEAPQ